MITSPRVYPTSKNMEKTVAIVDNSSGRSQVGEESPWSAVSNSPQAVPSELTIENLKKHEEETEAIDVVELMTINRCKDVYHDDSEAADTTFCKEMEDGCGVSINNTSLDYVQMEKAALKYPILDRSFPSEEEILRTNNQKMQLFGDIWSQPKRQTAEPMISPAVREEVKGLKFSGEEYFAVSVDVQTDESYLAEAYQYDLGKMSADPHVTVFHSKAAYSADKLCKEKPFASTERENKTTDPSTMDITNDECSVHDELSGILSKQLRTRLSTEESDVVEDGLVKHVSESQLKSSEVAAQTLKSVGPPFILQYKPESETMQPDYTEIDLSIPGNLKLREVTVEGTDYYDVIMEDMKQLREDKTTMLRQGKQLISIEPHSSFGSQHEKKVAKDRERERSIMKDLRKHPKLAAGVGGQTVANQTNFYAFARQLKTVNYSLSSEKCMEEGWTIRPVTPSAPTDPISEIFVHDDLQIASSKKYQHVFVKKLYENGSTFMIIFPDGTGNVWYPSGLLAFSIVSSQKLGRLTFIVHEDIHPSEGENIQAVFEPSGYCTCYYPSGMIRLSLTPLGGEYYSPQGERLKKWLWKDKRTHVHAPPFQPITFGLSKRIGVRVVSQESIFVTFTDGSRSVRFNAGTRLRLKAPSLLPKKYPVNADQVILNEKRLHVLGIIEKMQNSLKFSSSPRLERIQLSKYLTAQFDKTEGVHEGPNNQKDGKTKSGNTPALLRKHSVVNAMSCEKLPIIELKTKNFLTNVKSKSYKKDGNYQPAVVVN